MCWKVGQKELPRMPGKVTEIQKLKGIKFKVHLIRVSEGWLSPRIAEAY